jgi:hypothetical protein
MWTMSMGADAPLDQAARQAHLFARYDLQRREAETTDPDRVDRVDRAVREFPVSAYAASVLPRPLPLERVEKLPRARRVTLGSGHVVRFELVEVPGEVRGWLLDGVAVSIHGTVMRAVYEAVGKAQDAALPPVSRRGGGVQAVTGRIVGWEAVAAPLAVEGAGGMVAVDTLLGDFLDGRGRF